MRDIPGRVIMFGGVGSSVKGAGEHVSLAFKDGEDEFTLKTPLEPFNSPPNFMRINSIFLPATGRKIFI